jgi:DNA polymerase V
LALSVNIQGSKALFGLIDCNNFYVSCERLFNPSLEKKPVVVLSNNDGCIISRSNEAKELNIKMGEPFFQLKQKGLLSQVHVLSSNYTLYADISSRIFTLLSKYFSDIEIYSIDEAFIKIPQQQREEALRNIQKISHCLGIPVTVGLARTKVLAKIAQKQAKLFNCFHYFIDDPFSLESQKILQYFSCKDIWGVGKKTSNKLLQLKILSAYDLQHCLPSFIKKFFTLYQARLVLELQGLSCLGIEEESSRSSFRSTQTFGKKLTTLEQVWASLVHHMTKLTLKMQDKNLTTSLVEVRLTTQDGQTLKGYEQIYPSSSDLFILLNYAKKLLKNLFQKRLIYKKSGIILHQLKEDKKQHQNDFFTKEPSEKETKLLKTISDLHKKFGSSSVLLAAELNCQSWKRQSNFQSKAYTTKWDEIAVVKS